MFKNVGTNPIFTIYHNSFDNLNYRARQLLKLPLDSVTNTFPSPTFSNAFEITSPNFLSWEEIEATDTRNIPISYWTASLGKI